MFKDISRPASMDCDSLPPPVRSFSVASNRSKSTAKTVEVAVAPSFSVSSMSQRSQTPTSRHHLSNLTFGSDGMKAIVGYKEEVELQPVVIQTVKPTNSTSNIASPVNMKRKNSYPSINTPVNDLSHFRNHKYTLTRVQKRHDFTKHNRNSSIGQNSITSLWSNHSLDVDYPVPMTRRSRDDGDRATSSKKGHSRGHSRSSSRGDAISTSWKSDIAQIYLDLPRRSLSGDGYGCGGSVKCQNSVNASSTLAADSMVASAGASVYTRDDVKTPVSVDSGVVLPTRAAHSRKPSNVPISQLPALLVTKDPVPFTTANLTKVTATTSAQPLKDPIYTTHHNFTSNNVSSSQMLTPDSPRPPVLLSSLVTPPSPSEARPLPLIVKKCGNVDCDNMMDPKVNPVQAPRSSPLWAVWDWSGAGSRSTDGY
ncbi:hypothetical protein HDU76_003225 [Blyttiomyces sp. JEL0837]|nr:hypothetical protein HDU76_003225 [Blyttiomyces sp. JEL0837]